MSSAKNQSTHSQSRKFVLDVPTGWDKFDRQLGKEFAHVRPLLRRPCLVRGDCEARVVEEDFQPLVE